MPLPPGPEPHDEPSEHGRAVHLSPWERRAIDRMENDLTADDPAFAERMHWPADRWWPLSGFGTTVLLVALVHLVVVAALIPASVWAVFVLIVTLVIVPVLAWAATEGRRHR